MDAMKKFLVIGPTQLDIQVFLQDLSIADSITCSYTIGGKGFNIAHNLNLFHVPVNLCSIYGDDMIGTFLQDRIKKVGIETFPSNIVNHSSSLFIGVHDSTGSIIFDRVDTSIFEYQRLPTISWSDIGVVIVLSSTNSTLLNELITIKKSYPEILFCLEMAGSKTIKHINPYIKIFNMLIANRRETLAFAEFRGWDGSFEDIISSFLQDHQEKVIITLDDEGIIYGERSNSITINSVPAVPVTGKIVSTLGAGDAVTAATCACLFWYNRSMLHSLSIAAELASLTIQTQKPYIDSLPIEIESKV